MDLSRIINSTLLRWLLVATLAGGARAACAADVDINFEFVPDAGAPNNKTFTNKSAITGICAEQPQKCSAAHTGSSKVDVRFRSGPIYDFRENTIQFRIPQASNINVKSANGKQYPVTVHIRGVGARYDLSPATVLSITGINPPEGHKSLWAGGWLENIDAPCRAIPGLDSGMSMGFYSFFWFGPEGATCGKKVKYSLPGLFLDSMNFMYEVKTPNPYEMDAGLYEGRFFYNVDSEFNPGHFLKPYQSMIEVNVTLRVTHVFRVNMLGDSKVVLNPPQGWEGWEGSGRPPTLLYAEVPLSLEASSPFTVKLQCDTTLLVDCALKSTRGKIIKVGTFFYPPGGVMDDGGGSASRYRLSALTPKKFNVSQYVSNLGKLSFEIPATEFSSMETGTTYSGTVTVVWDSQV